MNAYSQSEQPSRIVVVVGIDMSSVSEHLLAQVRSILRPVDEAEVHVVHVVAPEPPLLRVVRPKDEKDAGSVYAIEHAQFTLERLCSSLGRDPQKRVIMHTPVGDAAGELTRIASEVGADILVIEAHEHDSRDPLRVFRRSVVENIASAAPCTVLTIRQSRRTVEASMSLPEEPLRPTWTSPS
jgi:nucleotide-binding universal stress UspA family protein